MRVSGKSKDELQKVIARLREESEGYPVAAPVRELSLGGAMNADDPRTRRILLILAVVVVVGLLLSALPRT